METSFRSGFAAIVGCPNVGKSTLLNALVGRKVAIVSEKPQTTRNRILGVRTEEGYQMVFLDTPGFMAPRSRLDAFMVKVAESSLQGVDVVLLVVDGSRRPGPGDRRLAESLPPRVPVLLAMNKVDLIPPGGVQEALEAYASLGEFRAQVPVSARKGYSLDKLLEHIRASLPLGPRYYPEETITDQPDAFWAAEIVREKVLEQVREEVPYAVAVVVEEFVPRTQQLLYVRAVVYCEKEGQRGILIGENGGVLKTVGVRARRELEANFGKRVFLDLWVKVKPGWRDDPVKLQQLGYRMT